MTLLVTGAAGFIGSSVAKALLERGEQVIGIDNLNDYYDPALKHARLEQLRAAHGNAISFEQVDFGEQQALEAFAAPHRFDRIIHLGAQARSESLEKDPQRIGIPGSGGRKSRHQFIVWHRNPLRRRF